MLEQYNIENLVDHIYKTSSINNFIKVERVSGPHFSVFTDEGNQYYSLDNYHIEASMKINRLMSLQHTYNLDINNAFLATLVNEVNFHLDDMFIRYIDSKASHEHVSFEDKSYFKNIIRLFNYNTRFSFVNKKIDHKKAKNLVCLFENLYREMYQYSEDRGCYLIVSKPIAEFIAHHIDEFRLDEDFKNAIPRNFENKKHVTIPFGVISGTFNIFINECMKNNVIYMGLIKRYASLGPILYYYQIPNSIIEYSSLAEHYADAEKHYRLNISYKLITHHKNNIFKKIILDI